MGPSLPLSLFRQFADKNTSYVTQMELAEFNIKLRTAWGLAITADVHGMTVPQELFRARSSERSHFAAFTVIIISLHGTSGPKEIPVISIYYVVRSQQVNTYLCPDNLSRHLKKKMTSIN